MMEHEGCCAVNEGCNPFFGWFIFSVILIVLFAAGLVALTVMMCLKMAEEKKMKR